MMSPFDQTDHLDQIFDSADLRGALLEDKEFDRCTFSGGQFAGARFLRCKLIGCTVRGGDWSNVIVKGSAFRDTAFEDAKMIGIDWTEATVFHASFVRCQLNLADFGGVDLRKSKIEDCVAREVEWSRANLSEADCRGTDFSGGRFFHTNLTRADFRRAKGYVLNPVDNVLKKTKFSLPEAVALLRGLDIELDDGGSDRES